MEQKENGNTAIQESILRTEKIGRLMMTNMPVFSKRKR